MSTQENPGQSGPQGGPTGSVEQLSESDAKLWATLSHLGFIIGGFITPLVIWLIQKDKSEYVAHHAKEALNFQITMAIAFVSCFILTFLVIGIFLLPLVAIAGLVFGILALIEANKGNRYKYPVSIRLVK